MLCGAQIIKDEVDGPGSVLGTLEFFNNLKFAKNYLRHFGAVS